MRIKCITCDVLARPVYLAAAYTPHTIDVCLQRFGLHVTPQKLREVLQAEINSADQAGYYDAVVLAYGLCGKATHGLRAGSVPLVIPRAHDCITLFLGGRAHYDREFNTCSGTYWYVSDYIARGDSEASTLSIGAFTATDADGLYAEYVEKYGEDNALYLMDMMRAWQTHYERAAFIDLGLGGDADAMARAHEDALTRGWRFERLTGDLVLVKLLLAGGWGEDFLVLQPGQVVEMSGDEEIIQAGK